MANDIELPNRDDEWTQAWESQQRASWDHEQMRAEFRDRLYKEGVEMADDQVAAQAKRAARQALDEYREARIDVLESQLAAAEETAELLAQVLTTSTETSCSLAAWLEAHKDATKPHSVGEFFCHQHWKRVSAALPNSSPVSAVSAIDPQDSVFIPFNIDRSLYGRMEVLAKQQGVTVQHYVYEAIEGSVQADEEFHL